MGTTGGTSRQLELLTVHTGMGTLMRSQTRAQGTNSFESVIRPNSFEGVFWTDSVEGLFWTDTVKNAILMDTV